MLTVAVSLLFGLFAFAAIAQIVWSVSRGTLRGQQILAELGRGQGRTRPLVKPMPVVPVPRWAIAAA